MDPKDTLAIVTEDDEIKKSSLPDHNSASGIDAEREQVQPPSLPTALQAIQNIFEKSGEQITDEIGIFVQLESPPPELSAPTATTIDALKRENAALRKYGGKYRDSIEGLAATSIRRLRTQEDRYEQLGNLYRKEKSEKELLQKSNKRLHNALVNSYQAKKPFLPTFAESDDHKIWNLEEQVVGVVRVLGVNENIDNGLKYLDGDNEMAQINDLFHKEAVCSKTSKNCSCTVEKKFKSSNLNKSRREEFKKRRNSVQLLNDETKKLYCEFCYRLKNL